MSEAAGTDDEIWSSRCCFWQEQVLRICSSRAKTSREMRPLILSGFGVSLRVESGTLRIRNGFTHHPQKQELFRFFKGDLDLPERIILLDCTGSLSFDVMTWLSEQGVALIKLDWQARMTGFSSPVGYSANPFRVDWQRTIRNDDGRRMTFCNHLITSKIESSIKTLEQILPRNPVWESAMRTAYAALTKLEENPANDVGTLRGIEGAAAHAYFRAWNDRPLRWLKRSRHPIPTRWRRVGMRGSPHYATGNNNAHHPINAILNYAYAVLHSQVRVWAIAEGYDPSIGIMHETRSDASPFVLDMMELHRAEIDLQIFRFMKEHEFDPMDFTIREDGVCRLNPDMARAITALIEGRSLDHRKAQKLIYN